jgi:hypothetical protein
MTVIVEMDKVYTTRDRRPVRILCVDGPWEQPVAGILGANSIARWALNGKYWPDKMEECDLDLILAKTKRGGWVNVYMSGGDHVTRDTVFTSKQAAEEKAEWLYGTLYIATIQIEWEE